MKKIIILFVLTLISLCSFSQSKVYIYHLYLYDSTMIPEFGIVNDEYKYTGNNLAFKTFFQSFNVLKLEKEYPTTNWENFSRILSLETTNFDLAEKLVNKFPSIFKNYVDLTNEPKAELLFYPNDYGTTSPVTNLGATIERSDLDYIEVNKAWDITTGIGMKIGISDAKINTTNADYIGKVNWVNPSVYQSMNYSPNNPNTAHGTAVAGIAAARGNNGYGSTGICYDCQIVGTDYGSYPNLLALAQSGVRVINMSWASMNSTNLDYSLPIHQERQAVIDSLVNHYKVVLVAGAGNQSSYQTNTDYYCEGGSSNGPNFTGLRYGFPASYNGVISVSSINHKPAFTLPLSHTQLGFCCTSPTIDAYILQDAISTVNGNDINNPQAVILNGYPRVCNSGTINQYISSQNGLCVPHTTNPEVDILSPTHETFRFDIFTEQNNSIVYTGGGTSGATPRVSATAALMISVNDCLFPSEVDAILKLTTKDVENMPMNQIFHGQIGAGSLKTGDAVVFVNEMKKTNGNAIIDNHIFDRFRFVLNKINNKLTINNVTFKDYCFANFTARNEIEILSGTSLEPNVNGIVDLKINSNMNIDCIPIVYSSGITSKYISKEKEFPSKIIISPNPSSEFFQVFNLSKDFFMSDSINLKIIDLNGRILYSEEYLIESLPNEKINIEILNSGTYIIKLSSNKNVETLKFIKE